MIIEQNILLKKSLETERKLKAIKSQMKNEEIMSWFKKDFAPRFCWSSNLIEGSTLSLNDTISFIDYDEVRSGHTYSEYEDAKNLYSAIQTFIIPFCYTEVDENWIKSVNRTIRGKDGEFRKNNIRIGNLIETVYIPPDFSKVPDLMSKFIDKVKIPEYKSMFETMKSISIEHLKFERIHPFVDGNGRTGRMIMNQQLINCGLLPVVITNSSDYRQAFIQYDRNGDYSKMMNIMLGAEDKSIVRFQKIVNVK